MMLSFATTSVAVVAPTWSTDARNNQQATYSGPGVTVDGCVALPGASVEYLGGRDTAAVAWTLLLPEGTDIDRHYAVDLRGVRYLVDGEPQLWLSPTGALSHVVVALRRFS